MYVLGKWCNLTPGKFIHTFGDVHVYSNHVEALKLQITRQPYNFPKLEFNGDFTLENLKDVEMDEWRSSFKIINYDHHPTIHMKMAV
jgi:thymidylate synthase